MPRPSKPCDGRLSQETLLLLRGSRDRAQWGIYQCEACGQSVGVEQSGGVWVPERHWPSVGYAPRDKDGRTIKQEGGSRQ